MGSPYPWHYTVRWPYYYVRPSVRRHTRINARPSTHAFGCSSTLKEHRLVFFGDMMCMRHDRIPAVDPALRGLLSSADLVIGNCEAPVTLRASRPDAAYLIVFKMSEEFVRGFLGELGIEPSRCVLSIANNHIGDQGQDGLRSTIRHLQAVGATVIGQIGDATSPLTVVNIGALRVGLVAWTHWLNREVFADDEGIWRTTHITKWAWPDAKESAAVDCLVGTPHWDYEFQHFPHAETQKVAHELMHNGFDLLVGHHPHVVQPIEEVGRSVCLYSIGNLNGPSLPYIAWPLRLASIFEVRLVASGPDRGRIASYTLHPFVQVAAGDTVSIVPLEKAPAALRHKLERRLNELFA